MEAKTPTGPTPNTIDFLADTASAKSQQTVPGHTHAFVPPFKTEGLYAEEAEREAHPQGAEINARYTIQNKLGQGGMGTVYLACDKLKANQEIALKTLHLDHLSGARLGLFKAEFKNLARLDHPNVARVFDFEALADRPGEHLFTME